MENSLRIAVCFHGQLRTGVKAAPNLKNFFGDLLPNIDFFVHTWDINTTRMPLNLAGHKPPAAKIANTEFEEFTQIYKPINFYVECQEQFWNRIGAMYGPGNTGELTHLWHSAYYSNQFKKTFEQLHNFKYDVVIRLRPDCIFPPDRKLKDDIEEFLHDPTKLYYLTLYEDTYYVSTSEILDIVNDMYIAKSFYGNHFWPANKLVEHMKISNIDFKAFLDNRMTVFRKEFDFLDPINLYWHINAINYIIYNNLNLAKDKLKLTYINQRNPNWEKDMQNNLLDIFGDNVTGHNTAERYFTFWKNFI